MQPRTSARHFSAATTGADRAPLLRAATVASASSERPSASVCSRGRSRPRRSRPPSPARAGCLDVDDLVMLACAPARGPSRGRRARSCSRPRRGRAAWSRRATRGARRPALSTDLEEAREPLALHLLGDVVLEPQRGRERPRRVLEAEERHEADLAHERQRLREVVLRLAGEADDDVGRQRQPRAGRARGARRARRTRRACSGESCGGGPGRSPTAPAGGRARRGRRARRARARATRSRGAGAGSCSASARGPGRRARSRGAGAGNCVSSGSSLVRRGKGRVAEAVDGLAEEEHLARSGVDEARAPRRRSRARGGIAPGRACTGRRRRSTARRSPSSS